MAARSRGRSSGKRPPTNSSDRWPDDPVTRYARGAVDGKIVVGELVCHAGERHLRDLTDGRARGLHWSPEGANRILRFLPAVFSITAGALAGKPFNPLPWHAFSAGSLFGWKRDTGRLRFRNAWLETGKGQAKSPLIGALGLYMMGWHGIPRSEVYSIGWDKRTANVLFSDAVSMCRAQVPGREEGETLENLGKVIVRGVLGNAWKIEHPATESYFQALANTDNFSGPRPSFVGADEIHEFKDEQPLKTWRAAIAKQPHDAMLVMGTNTPASTQIVGSMLSEFYAKIAKGEAIDDEAFAFIARVDVTDRETVFDNEACWAKAMPALGITFPIENIRGEVASARINLSTAMSTKRLYFGIPTGAVSFWIVEDAWAAVQSDGPLDTEAMVGWECWLSLDLSDKNDLTALTATWKRPSDGHLFVKTWYWTTKAGLAERALSDNAPYELWVEQKHLTAVDAPIIDKTFVAAEVKRLVGKHNVQFLTFDVAGIDDFIDACDEIGLAVWKFAGNDKPAGSGLMMVSHAQGTRVRFEEKQLSMPRSVERLEDVILGKAITIEASPVTYMCAANALVVADGQNNRAFDKRRSRGRIDGLVTIAMGSGAAKSGLIATAREYKLIIV